jgi:hypothetical protein
MIEVGVDADKLASKLGAATGAARE